MRMLYIKQVLIPYAESMKHNGNKKTLWTHSSETPV